VPRPLRITIIGGLGALLLTAGAAWLVRGQAILLDLAAGSARLLCL
jgi:hypothetical protein